MLTPALWRETFARISGCNIRQMEAFVPQEFEAIRIPFELIYVAPDYDLTLRHARPFIKASF